MKKILVLLGLAVASASVSHAQLSKDIELRIEEPVKDVSLRDIANSLSEV